LDDWGYPVVDSRPIDDEEWLRHASRAVATCPRLALQLEGVAALAVGSQGS
jgi:ferredoxin